MSDQNSLEIVPPVAFTAGETKEWAFTGSYFELIDCPSPVDVDLTDRNGSVRTRMRGAEASFYSKSVEFGRIVITSATAQTIKFAYGSGEAGTRRSTGSVVVSGAVALDAATLAALEQINVRPEAPTGSWNSSVALALNTPQTVFAPGANPNGTYLLAAGSSLAGNAALSVGCFVAKAGAAPANPNDGEMILAPSCSAGTSNYLENSQLPKDQYIPPNFGLYFISAGPVLVGPRYARWKAL